jgi:ABC-type polysaccharide/polyol phosphate export permease/Flp pilus assembly protein TadD
MDDNRLDTTRNDPVSAEAEIGQADQKALLRAKLVDLVSNKSDDTLTETEVQVIRSATLATAEWREVWQRLISAQKLSLAVSLFETMPRKVLEDGEIRYNWAYALNALGRITDAMKILDALIQERPNVAIYKTMRAHILLKLSRPGEAVAAFEELIEMEPENWHHVIAIANTYTVMGKPNAALQALQTFEAKGFGNETTLVHAAVAAKAVGRTGAAEDYLLRAISLSPGNPQPYHLLADCYLGLNRLADAQDAIDTAIQLAPHDINYKNMRLAIIERRAVDARPIATSDVKLRTLPVSKYRRDGKQTSALADLLSYWRVIWNLALRDIRTRESKSPIGIAMAVVEPLAHVVALWLVMSVVMHGRPPLGEHWFFFYATGILPYLMLSHLGGHGVHGHAPHKHLLEVPIIKPVSVLVGAAIAELIIAATIAVILFGSFYLLGIYKSSNNAYGIIGAYLAIWLLGVGIMFLNTGISSMLPLWGKAWYTIQRVLYFASGIFYMAQSMPVFVRDILVWNPLLVGIEWFRNGFFNQYEPPWLDKGYLLLFAGCTLVLGVAIESIASKRAHE